jgi:hypothetical protein
MEKKELKAPGLARRDFLKAAKGAGALGAAAVLAGRGATVQAAPVAPVVDEAAQGSGYRETEHIRNYYRTARYW